MNAGEWVRRIFTRRYARALEDELARTDAEILRTREENDRLRVENRALLNSILGIAGIPPVITTAPGEAELQWAEAARGQRRRETVLPRRRRSWHQVTQSLELASLRRPQTENARVEPE